MSLSTPWIPTANLASFEEIEDDTFAFRLIDSGVLQEGSDSVTKTVPGLPPFKVWQVDAQTVDELPCPQDMSAAECYVLDKEIGTKDFDLWTDLRLVRIGENGEEIVLADIDIDKVFVPESAGGGNEFGADDLGIGSKSNDIIYNIDARSRLSSGDFNKSPSRQALGFRVVK